MKKLRKISTIVFILSFCFLSAPELRAVYEGEDEGLKEPKEEITETRGVFPEGIFPAQPGVPPISKEPEYAPGQLIVKLKEGKTLEDIQELNAKYNVTSTEEVFQKIADPKETLQELKNKLSGLESKEHKSWYWQLDKDSQEYKDYLARIEKEKQTLQEQIKAQEELLAHLEQRQKRAPEGATAPNLDNIYLLNTEDTQTNIPLMASDYKANPAIEYAEPNYIATVQMLPNDPLYPQQWAHQKTQAEKAWDITIGGSNVVIAIVDTGVDYNHEDLKNNIWKDSAGNPGKDFVDIDTTAYQKAGYTLIPEEDYTEIDNNPSDYYGHGTHCGGIVGAKGNNQIGVAGVCHNCKIMPVRAGFAIKQRDDTYGSLEYDDIANAIMYAADMGADVISMSFGGYFASETLKAAIDYAYSYPRNCILVAAAGNDDTSVKNYPAAYDNVIAIAATAADDTRAYYSNFGSWVDVAAPGGDYYKDSMILSTVPKKGTLSDPSGYRALQGTSMACPYVAGLTGLLLSKYPGETNKEIRGRIVATGDPYDKYNSYNLNAVRINAYKALTENKKPYFKIQEVKMEEQEGDGDQIPESGEKIKLIIKLKNVWKDVPSVTATLTGQSEFISSIIVPISKLDSYPTDETKDNSSNPFIFQIGRVKYEGIVDFILVTNADGVEQHLIFKVSLGIRPICTALGSQKYPKISGNKVVWVDGRHGASELYLYDLDTEQERRITNHGKGVGAPSISSNKIVWEDGRSIMPGQSVEPEIYLYDLVTNQEKLITHGLSPSIFDDKVVYRSWRNRKYSEIYLYDLTNKCETKISNVGYDGFDPCISNNKVVWWSRPPEGKKDELYLYDLKTKETRLITNEEGIWSFSFSANKIVWASLFTSADGNSFSFMEVYVYDIDNNQKRTIFRYPYYIEDFSISDNRIVWHDGAHLYLYDLVTDKTERITRTDYKNKRKGVDVPCISGNRIVWADYRNGDTIFYLYMASDLVNPDIYMTEIPEALDSTPPTPPVVTDEGEYTTKTDQLYASWAPSSDAESGITEYQYQITQDSTSGTVITSWTSNSSNSVNVTDLSLSNGKTYYFGVKAKNGAGLFSEVGYSDGIAVSVSPPQAPSNLTATAISSTQIKLSWTDNSTDESGFKIERSESSTSTFRLGFGTTYTEIAIVGPNSTNTATFTNSGLTPGTTYSYQVRAYNAAGNSGYSSSASTTVVLPAPTNLLAQAKPNSSTEVNLTWTDNSADETGFKIERGTSLGTYVQIATVNANITTYSDTGLTPGTTYYYRVKAYNAAGNSGYCTPASATVVLPAPTNLVATATASNKIELTWTDKSTDESGFKIERSESSTSTFRLRFGTTYTEIATVGANVTTYSDTGLSAGTTYSYRVRAYNTAGNSDYSNTASETISTTVTDDSAPVAANQTVTTAEDTDKAITLSATDAEGDRLTYTIVIQPAHGALSGTAPNLTYIPAANYNGSDSFSFKANDGKLDSNTAAVSITVSAVNDAPVLASIGNKTIDEGKPLSFILSATDVDGDNLTYSATGATGLPTGATFTASSRTFSWTPTYAQSGTYSNIVFSVSDGKGGSASETISITVTDVVTDTTPPQAPSNLTATAISSTQIKLTWTDNSTEETGFKIERSESSTSTFRLRLGTTYTEIATVGANTTNNPVTYTDSGLVPGTTYSYRVRAYNVAGNSGYSNTVSAMVVLPAPTNLVAQAISSTQIKLTWQDKSTDESGFKIERSESSTSTFRLRFGTTYTEIATVGANVTTFTDSGLVSAKLYYYRVRAYVGAVNSSYSNTAYGNTY